MQQAICLQKCMVISCCKNRRETLGTKLLCCCLQPAWSSFFVKDGWQKVNMAFLWRSCTWFFQLSGADDTWFPSGFLGSLLTEGQTWKAWSMAMESQLEQAWDQDIWRQREVLAKRKIKSCFVRWARCPSKASYTSRPNPGALVLAAVWLYHFPKYTSMLRRGQIIFLQSSVLLFASSTCTATRNNVPISAAMHNDARFP